MCDWCGHEHPREALCARRPTWGRRGFLALFGSGVAGLALGGLPTAPTIDLQYTAQWFGRFEDDPAVMGGNWIIATELFLAVPDEATVRRLGYVRP